MNKYSTALFLIFLVFGFNHINAQSLGSNNTTSDPFFSSNGFSMDGEIFTWKVKLLDQFIHRFNFTQNIKGDRIELPADSITERRKDSIFNACYLSTRTKMVLSLFDFEREWPDTGLVRQFTSDICSKNIEIHLSDRKWEAWVTSVVEFDGKKDSLLLIMQNVQTGSDAAKWVIKNASAKFLEQPINYNKYFIQPLAHETNFIELSKTFSSGENISDATEASENWSPLRLLEYYTALKKIKYLYTSNITYHFYHYPGYEFIVDELIRAQKNSGWLITDIRKINSKDPK
jgi:hypothetical protein